MCEDNVFVGVQRRRRDSERGKERLSAYLSNVMQMKAAGLSSGTRPLIGVPCTVTACHSAMSCGGANLVIVIEF